MQCRKASSARLCCRPLRRSLLLRRSVLIDVGGVASERARERGGHRAAALDGVRSAVHCGNGERSGAKRDYAISEGGRTSDQGRGRGRVEGRADGAAAALSSVFIRQASVI